MRAVAGATVAFAVGLLATFSAQAADRDVAAGLLVARRSCAECHSVGAGASPLADAPPFRTLPGRYRAGGLAELLGEGMLADYPRGLEEGRRPLHPRMPAVALDGDEIAHLAAFLRSFEPAPNR